MEVEQRGIKWWKRCARCKWEGNAKKQDNDHTVCPNGTCGNVELTTHTDEYVNNGKRYDRPVRNRAEREAEDKRRLTPAPSDTKHRSNPGYAGYRT